MTSTTILQSGNHAGTSRKLLFNIFYAVTLFFALSILLFLCSGVTYIKSCLIWDEDQLIENLQFLISFATGIVWMIAIHRARRRVPTERLRFFAVPMLFALAFLWLAGEEISWGQRIFDIATPDLLATINAQQETNLHNIPIFYVGSYPIFPTVLFYVGAFAWGIFLPIIHRFVTLDRLFFIAIPIPHVSTIPYFVAPVLFRFFYYNKFGNDAREGMEILLIGAFFIVAVHAMLEPLDIMRSNRQTAPRARSL